MSGGIKVTRDQGSTIRQYNDELLELIEKVDTSGFTFSEARREVDEYDRSMHHTCTYRDVLKSDERVGEGARKWHVPDNVLQKIRSYSDD